MNDPAHVELLRWFFATVFGVIATVATLFWFVMKHLITLEEANLLKQLQESIQKGIEAHNENGRAHAMLVENWDLRRERRLEEYADRITVKVREAMTGAIQAHNADIHAHVPAHEHSLAPVQASIDKLGDRLDTIDQKLDALREERQVPVYADRSNTGGRA